MHFCASLWTKNNCIVAKFPRMRQAAPRHPNIRSDNTFAEKYIEFDDTFAEKCIEFDDTFCKMCIEFDDTF